MPNEVCLLSAQEVHDYLTAQKRELRRSTVDGLLPGSISKDRAPGHARHLRIEYVTDYRLNHAKHRHIKPKKAEEMVKASLASWIGPGKERIGHVAQPAVRGLSVRVGFDAAGNTITNKGIPMSMVVMDATTDWIGTMLSEVSDPKLRLPVTSSFGGGTANGGGGDGKAASAPGHYVGRPGLRSVGTEPGHSHRSIRIPG